MAPSTSQGPSTGHRLVVAALAMAVTTATAVSAAPPHMHEAHEGGSYIKQHFKNEHHIDNFDLGSFFAVHDLNRDGVLDRSEIEAIYGVHHSLSVKHSPTHEVHDAKADEIVKTVLARLDSNHDGQITKREFLAGGEEGLPDFPQFGKGALGHHYDEESEFFMHHEEIYHNTPELQKPSAYTHPEDVEHFAHHDAIERQEEERERKAEGMPSIEEDERLKKVAEAQGKVYVSPYDAQIPQPGTPPPVHQAWNAHAGGHAAQEASANTQHHFKGPNGNHLVKTTPDQAINAEQAAVEHDLKPDRLEGETDAGYADRLRAAKEAYEAKQAQDRAVVDTKHRPNETDEDYQRRIAKAKFDAAKARPGISPPSDQAKKAAPNKYPPIGGNRRKKGSFFGEF
ncbi:unnamed protein product [Parajaminaea phylloscopi]